MFFFQCLDMSGKQPKRSKKAAPYRPRRECFRKLVSIDRHFTSEYIDRQDAVSHKALPINLCIQVPAEDPLHKYLGEAYTEVLSSVNFMPVADFYPMDAKRGYCGFTVVTRRDINKNEIIPGLVGVTALIPPGELDHLLDFSVFQERETGPPTLMLGPLAFVNSRCLSNCSYSRTSSSEDVYRLKAKTLIKCGTELTVFYGRGYFGDFNEECCCPDENEHLRPGQLILGTSRRTNAAEQPGTTRFKTNLKNATRLEGISSTGSRRESIPVRSFPVPASSDPEDDSEDEPVTKANPTEIREESEPVLEQPQPVTPPQPVRQPHPQPVQDPQPVTNPESVEEHAQPWPREDLPSTSRPTHSRGHDRAQTVGHYNCPRCSKLFYNRKSCMRHVRHTDCTATSVPAAIEILLLRLLHRPCLQSTRPNSR